VRVVAENVLGSGPVISARVSEDGAQAFIRWESVTYKPTNRLAATRELMLTEAQLVTGSVIGQLSPIERIRFTIVKQGRMLATGENRRGGGVIVMFSKEIGGGVARPTSSKRDPDRPRGGEAAREL